MVGPDIYARPLSSPLQPVHLSPKAASLGLLAACLQCIMYGVGMAAHHAEGTDLGREGGTTRHLATPHSDENCQICNRASARDSGRRRALRRQPAECTQRTLDNLGGVELGRHVFCRHQRVGGQETTDMYQKLQSTSVQLRPARPPAPNPRRCTRPCCTSSAPGDRTYSAAARRRQPQRPPNFVLAAPGCVPHTTTPPPPAHARTVAHSAPHAPPSLT
jgi:hypothetical protein